jgi:thiamine transport system ATP-binding protein
MIRITGLTKSFGEGPVVHDLDLTVATGETVALLGPSGVGKSTLLRMIAGLEVPDRGVVAVDGVDLAGTATHERGIGYMFQDLALFPHLDVASNVEFGLRMQRLERAQRKARVQELLDLVGLADAGGRDPASLSGGERQRVALARALAPQPSALLLDEPFGALDRTLRDRLLAELRSIFDELRLTVVAVTHDPTEAAALAARIAVMLDGEIVQVGPPADLFSAPGNRRIAATLGLRNVLEGPVDDGWIEAGGWGRFPTSLTAADAGLLVPRGAIRRSQEHPGATGSVEVVVTEVVLRDGQGVAVIEPLGGGGPLEADLPGSAPGERCRVVVEPGLVRAMG